MHAVKKLYGKLKTALADERKTYARTPRQFTFKDWKNALLETKNALSSKRIFILSAGIAYFLTFAVFPAIAASVAILSFAISKEQLEATVRTLESFLPSDIAYLISTQLQTSLDNPSSGIFVIIGGLLIALYSLSNAMKNIINASNAIYETEETRKLVPLRLLGIGFVVVASIITLIVISLLVLNEPYLRFIGVSPFFATTIIIARWLIIALLVAVGLAVFYRYAPNRGNPHWQWVTWGSSIATIVWLLGTSLFFIYARYLAHYTESYSVFAGIIVLMIWLNLTAFAALLGAEINFRLENQTRARTTA